MSPTSKLALGLMHTHDTDCSHWHPSSWVLLLLLLLLLPFQGQMPNKYTLHLQPLGTMTSPAAVSKYKLSRSKIAASAILASKPLPLVNGQLSDPLHSWLACHSAKGHLVTKYRHHVFAPALCSNPGRRSRCAASQSHVPCRGL